MSEPLLPFGGGDDRTISQARAELFAPHAFRSPGGRNPCPCCGQNTKLRARRLNAGMAAILCWLVRKSADAGGDFIDVHAVGPRFALRSNEVSRMEHWGLVEAKKNDDESMRDSGMWRPTQLGIDFANGAAVVPSHAMIFDNTVREWSTATFSIHDALAGGKFDYAELMGRKAV